ncbi:allantoinase AllB [Paenibacillus macerans]|uniref:allantoinase AllB n=1 Tax=Paenibacillus macerans TaxID=44252 RepID=UPI001F0FE85B|nr:allantoinase AllB [Paenibacillus macerans]MEC0140299.1 allantoinase AllB [Paenibacillus macerans]UMV49804.1 allantoinase AllB [Paenibacillus macerans]
MAHYDTVIRGGQVVLPDRVLPLDIGIKDGVIAALDVTGLATAEEKIDAAGLVVVPGMIDAHVHLNEPGLADWEGVPTGTSALAAGGCTTCIDMPLNGLPPTTTVDALTAKQALFHGRSYTDYAFWGGLVPGNLEQLAPLAAAGAIGYKAFMSAAGGKQEGAFREADDLTLYEGMREIARLGKILALHAESEQITSALAAHKRRAGQCSARAYLESRPVYAEVEAVKRALFYAKLTDCSLHFVHISSPEAAEFIRQARLEGQDVTLETCPHYLILTEDDLEEIGPLAKCAPPLRSAKEREGLWDLIENGCIDMITSDHSPCPPELKASADWFAVWGGISGAQSSLELLLGEGHVRRSLELPLLCRMLSANPARRFGLAPAKGAIAPEADADLALVDFTPYRLKREHLLDRHKHNPYVGKEFGCRVVRTLVRGKTVYDTRRNMTGPAYGRHAYRAARLNREKGSG